MSQALAQLSSIFVFAPNICRGRKYSNTEQFECRSTLVIETEGRTPYQTVEMKTSLGLTFVMDTFRESMHEQT